MSSDLQSLGARYADRIFGAFPVAQPAFSRLLQLLDIEASREVPTAAVTLGQRSRLLLNPEFVAAACPSDTDLVMLVLHELYHIALGHTRLFPRLTPAQNWAFDCVINAQLCRLYPEPHHTALFRRCYSATEFPGALLRPPEGWGQSKPLWIGGRAGEVHRALYSDDSVTYTDLYALLPTLSPVGELQLLGDHSEAAEQLPPDLLREVRGILAEWPMVERISGRDQGGALAESKVAKAKAQRAAAGVLRRAILSIADRGAASRGAPQMEQQEREGLLPYALRPRRADFVRQALGVSSLLHAERIAAQGIVRYQRVHVYLDVSGSMESTLPALYATLVSLAELLHPQVHLFSTEIDDINLEQLRRGVRFSTGGTDISPVTAHAIKHRVQRALFVTDGWVGTVPDEHARTLRERRTRFAVALTQQDLSGFASALDARVWQLPRLEQHS